MNDVSVAVLGPYSVEVVRTSAGISKINILKKPRNKSKKLNTKIDQLEELRREPLDLEGTEFQQKVWEAARTIPAGETRTYGEIAQQIGAPRAVRAVGTALSKNPACIVVPCHRVVPKSGGIGHYAYGKAMKRWLLEQEKSRP